MSYTIEAATPADAADVAALHYLSHTRSFAPFASPEWVASRRLECYRAQWRDLLGKGDPRGRTWVARPISGSVVGMVRVYPMQGEGLAQLASMHVHPDHQNRGLGRSLMKTAEEFIREAGHQRAVLGVIEANQRARSLYEKSGWTVIERHPTGVEGVPVLVYGKEFLPWMTRGSSMIGQ